MSAYVFRVVPHGANWVIRSANDQIIYGYATRERACVAAEAAAEQLRGQGQEVIVLCAEAEAEAVAA
jgi:hypothetical protein